MAVRALLDTLGFDVFYVDAPTRPDALPYVVLVTSSGRMAGPALCADLTDLDELMRVMVVDTTPEGVIDTHEQIRATLHGAHPPVAGRAVTVWLLTSEPVGVDRDMTLVSTNRHPAYGVDIYRLTSVPAPVVSVP
jgi:hypothetical protein